MKEIKVTKTQTFINNEPQKVVYEISKNSIGITGLYSHLQLNEEELRDLYQKIGEILNI